jgi:type II secretory pathway pseudopilin PulG
VHRQRGFTYLGLLFAIAVLGITLATVGILWSTQIKREKEAQLLWTGDQYRQAIARYVASGGQYPQALEDLLLDKRFPQARRYLRQLYPDPMTGAADWQLVLGPNGAIIGVASTSQDKPIKVANFPLRYVAFEKAEVYADWKFVNTGRFQRPRRAIRPAGSN